MFISEDIQEIFDNYRASIDKTEDFGGHCRTVLYVAVDGCAYQFDIVHNGTISNFLKNVIDNLERFDGVGYAKELISLYDPDSFDDMEWYMQQARELEEACSEMRDDLAVVFEETECEKV